MSCSTGIQHTVQVPIIIVGQPKLVAKRFRVTGEFVDHLAVQHALEVASHRNVVGELAVGVDTSDCFGALLIGAASRRDGDVPAAVVGT